MAKRRPRHLVSVWNPAYAAGDIMDAHRRVLLDAIIEWRAGKCADEDIRVWWGKVRSENRQRPLPHLDEVLALDDEIPDEGEGEMHLYLTDYRSLYVGHVGGITDRDVRTEDPARVPAYYHAADLYCDCWFELWDLRRIVSDDTLAVIAELKKLRNTHYNDRPVSLYGGIVDLPLVVYRDDDVQYFDDHVRAGLLDGQFWVEWDAERAGLGLMERELRDNLLGDEIWAALDPAARTFVAEAEQAFRAHRGDAAFDFSGVVLNLGKAYEVQVNLLLRRLLAGLKPAERSMNVNGSSLDVVRGDPLGLKDLARALADERHLFNAIRRKALHAEWFTASLPPVLRELAEARNPAAHTGRVDREVALRLRNRHLGIGSQPVLGELAKVRPR